MRTLICTNSADAGILESIGIITRIGIDKYGDEIKFVLYESSVLGDIIRSGVVDPQYAIIAFRFRVGGNLSDDLSLAMVAGYNSMFGFGKSHADFVSGVVGTSDNVVAYDPKDPFVLEALRQQKRVWLPLDSTFIP